MQITLELPDDIAAHLQARNGDVSRQLLESIALEGYRSQELTHAQITQLLGFKNRLETDAFLKANGLFLEYGDEEMANDRETHRQLRANKAS